ncbi:MAG TPA: rod shape-determining protein MreC [Candidatus Bipolaricaulota bacterium]|nr:rod shape-determining protein MreC [Candidatus Bipolaricaulota bacterium]
MQSGNLKKISIVSFASILIIVILHYTGALSPVENLFMAAVKPVGGAVYRLSGRINDFYYNQKKQNELIAENDKLHEELIQMQIVESENQELKSQLDFYKRQIDFQNSRNVKGVIADVIGKSNDNYQNFLIIDKGEKHGIKVGNAVTNENVIVGKIYEVSKYTSKALLVNDSFSKLAVSVNNNDNSVGILSGEFGLGMKIDLIPQTEKLSEEDFVISSGLEEAVPRGLLVGQIDNVVYTEGELFQTAFVRSPIDFNKIHYVNVLTIEYAD